ncbi:hypothetical protein [Marisediminicola sp. LYQ85]|uniref:hypothetical protein n=1 Tax=Marisediminicola sp. LYQ85 TaxID=3391062 RepID=UPI003983386E
MGEEKSRLVRRMRLDVAAMVLSFFVQGAFLANVLESGGEAAAWIAWVVVLVIVIVVMVVAGTRASRLSKRYRQLKWGER